MTTTMNSTPRPALDPQWAAWPPGARVVVRRRLTPDEARATQDPATGEGQSVTDVIGIVVSVSPGASITLRTDAGGSSGSVEVTIPAEQLVAAKRIPPRPPRRLPRQPVD
ncbi:hypothetical protein [Oerskovia paurometabola]|uniref:Uncharacterized protein n=1 Tax=Oerskovia paurometabola TaxID=162170 RepID=A0ABW1XA01_9CELL|nr:hypothetical protein [Oerskovia paurometabola]MBM7498078.1 hypothetical protein [Oerskovia paurometabola]